MRRPRLLFIDNLRVLVITLVILLHLSITYGGHGGWYYRDGQADTISSVLLTWHNAAVQAFSMGLLFMLAGYFTPGSYDRKGPWRFLGDRLLRLGIPMLCYDLVIHPLLAYPLMKVNAIEFEGSYREFLAGYYGRLHLGTGPLWFVETLLIFAAAYVLWRAVAGSTGKGGQGHRAFPGNRDIVAVALILGAVTFAVRIWLPLGWAFEPLNLQFPFFPQYICLFVVGILAYRHNWLVRVPHATGRLWFGIAVVLIIILFPALFVLGGALRGDVSPFIGGFHWQSFAYSVWEQVVGVALIVGLPVLFREHLNRQGRLAEEASAGSYTAYIIHAPAIVLFALAVRDVTLYPLLKFALAATVAVPLCFALAAAIRRLPLARRIL